MFDPFGTKLKEGDRICVVNAKTVDKYKQYNNQHGLIQGFTENKWIVRLENESKRVVIPEIYLEKEEISDHFRILNLNGDKMSKDVIEDIFKDLGITDKYAMNQTIARCRKVDKKYIDCDEFHQIYREEEKLRMRNRFKALDFNGNGMITK
eukprot:UN31677